MTWYSFDQIASRYDATRKLDRNAALEMLEFLEERLPHRPGERVLELGIGTGRMAIPFAMDGYRVVGVDISRAMLNQLGRNLARKPGLRIESVRADAARLPFRDGSFSSVYWVHVLHLVPEWRRALDEVLRVTRPGGVLLDINTEGGRDSTDLAVRYRALARAKGYPQPRIGVRRRETILAYLARKGCRIERVRRTWPWKASTTVDRALRNLEGHLYATLNYVPASIHAEILRDLRRWIERTYRARSRTLEVTGRIRVQVATAPNTRRAGTRVGSSARPAVRRRASLDKSGA